MQFTGETTLNTLKKKAHSCMHLLLDLGLLAIGVKLFMLFIELAINTLALLISLCIIGIVMIKMHIAPDKQKKDEYK